MLLTGGTGGIGTPCEALLRPSARACRRQGRRGDNVATQLADYGARLVVDWPRRGDVERLREPAAEVDIRERDT